MRQELSSLVISYFLMAKTDPYMSTLALMIVKNLCDTEEGRQAFHPYLDEIFARGMQVSERE